MANAQVSVDGFTLKAYVGDFKTLLAFNFANEDQAKGLAGFTINYVIPGGAGYFLWNTLVFEHPEQHARYGGEPPRSTANSPIHKFRWVHVPGVVHQGDTPVAGIYIYRVTPRFFGDHQNLLPLDESKTATLPIHVGPFEKGNFKLGFTRGFVQSEAFVDRFGKDALIRPKDKTLIFDTQARSGASPKDNKPYSFDEEYEWSGFTARRTIFGIIDEVEKDNALRLDVFAYDLTEPDLIDAFKRLATIPGKFRLILDNASLHHSAAGDEPEDQAAALIAQAGGAAKVVKRGRFARYAHDKVFVVRTDAGPRKVMTGSTNFSVNGMYVNSNHVLVYDDPEVAGWYQGVFDTAWSTEVKAPAFLASDWSKQAYVTSSADLPNSTIHFSPHEPTLVDEILGGIVERVGTELAQPKDKASVLFAVMTLNEPKDVVYKALNAAHSAQSIFSYGISDAPDGIYFYDVGKNHGVLVTGKPGKTDLPAPFDQVPPIQEHQIHHKFVVCGFNRPDAVVYCGSSNLAEGGEHQNGDNLIAINDSDVATAFAIEALALVDHFNFLDNYAKKAQQQGTTGSADADKNSAAKNVHWYLGTTDVWKNKYFDEADLHCVDRVVFGG